MRGSLGLQDDDKDQKEDENEDLDANKQEGKNGECG